MYEHLNEEYKNLSTKLLEKHREQVDFVKQAKLREKELDKAFTERLALMDEEDSVSEELPKARRQRT